MFHHIRQNQFATRWKHSAGKFYPIPHVAYSPDLAPSDYYLFASMSHALVVRRYEKVNR